MRSAWRILRTLFALSMFAPVGCYSVVADAPQIPQPPPTSGITTTAAKPLEPASFANLNSAGVRIEVTPLESSAPTKTQLLIVAAVADEHGRPRRGRKVDWQVDGVGEIVQVDESGYLPSRGQKIDSHNAVSFTDYTDHTFKSDDGRDVRIEPGRTWCVLTSAIEGDMRVTVAAPEGKDGDLHKAYVTRHWCDSVCLFPPPAICPAGSRPMLTTQIVRASDRQPLANYKVRYRVIDGAPAQLLPGNAVLTEVASDAYGDARVAVNELAVQPGSTRIAIEAIRPAPTGPGVVIGRGETTLQWQAPVLAMTVTAPETSVIGADLPVTATVTNPGQVPTQPVVVRMPIPQGLQFVASDPPTQPNGGQVVWQLSAVPPRANQSLRATFRSPTAGTITASATAQSGDGLRADGQATTRIANPKLAVGIEGPTTVSPGESVLLQVSVANIGGGPATNVRIRASFDPGLTHDSGVRSLEVVVGTLAPGASQTVPLTLTAAQPGKPAVQVIASADGGLRADAGRAIAIAQRSLQLTLTGAPTQYINRPGTWNVRVVNNGDAALSNALARVRLPKELRFQSANNKGQFAAGEVVWTVGEVRPGEGRVLQLIAVPVDGAGQASLSGVASADKTPPQTAQATFEVMGMPVLHAEIVQPAAGIAAGGKAIFTIRVSNQGTLVARNVSVAIAAAVPFLTPRFGGGPTVGRVNGDRVEFAPIDRIETGQTVDFKVDVAANQPGDGRMRVAVHSDSMATPLTIEDSIRVVAPAAPGRLPAKP